MEMSSKSSSATSHMRQSAKEDGKNAKPFTPEEANNIVMSLNRPAVISNMVFDWPVRHWNVNYLADKLKGKKIRFRIGKKNAETVIQFETHCSYVEATLDQFLAWGSAKPVFPSPFAPYDSSKFWAYADYKYIAMLLDDHSEMFQDVVWSDFGFPDRNGRDSTLWIGTLGANTPCHVDSYGCNLVVQVQGRKRWHLFPPEDTAFLYPTRIPYEESSIFSKVNVANPDLKSFPQFKNARTYVVTLQPGEVLFVPRHWWHYVESIDPITVSVNSWIELVEVTPYKTNLQFLNQAVAACLENRGREAVKDKTHSPNKQDNGVSSFKKRKLNTDDCLEGHRSMQGEPGCSPVKMEHLPKIPPDLKFVSVLPQGFAESNFNNELCRTAVTPLEKTDKSIETNAYEMVLGEHPISEGKSSLLPRPITTNEVLDCLVDPQVVSLMARLLLERQGC
ncbi:HSPB1-associated protein 1 isoform X2 [Ambystoma mexicanum]|uniref:HSPB1-associated protein 1 isoform X2 n=1 Tax=Ambystoma mexicanum TaxID=8296 RepID=UPI0037E8DBF7